jgi:hypothetical protein
MTGSAGEMSTGGFRAAVHASGFRRLLIGQAVSSLGDWVATLAFIVAAFALTSGNTTAVAVVLVLRLVPPIFAAPVGGVVEGCCPAELARGALPLLAPDRVANQVHVPQAVGALAVHPELLHDPGRSRIVRHGVSHDALER